MMQNHTHAMKRMNIAIVDIIEQKKITKSNK